MKKPVKILVIAVAALFVLGFLKNIIAQNVVAGVASTAAHVPVSIGSMNVGMLSSSIRIKNLIVSNPAGFPDKRMVEIPQIFIDFEMGELLKGRAHFKEITLDLKEVTVVKNKEGKMNIDAVKPSEKDKAQSKEAAKTENKGKAPKLFIDKLSLSIGRVVYKDYSAGGAPAIQTFDINIKNREFSNIDNPTTIVSLIMFEALTRTTLSKLASFDVSAFKEGGLQALSGGLGVVNSGTESAEKAAKQIINLFKK